MVDSLLIEVLGRDGLLDDLLEDLLPQFPGSDVLGVLGRNDNSVNALGYNGTAIVLVLNSDLGLGVGSEPREGTVTASSGHRGVKLMCKDHSEGEELRSLVGGITEHDTLVTSTQLLKCLLVVQTLGDIGGLLLNGNQNIAGLVVEPLLRVVVTNVLDGATDDFLVVEAGLGGDFTENHHHTGLGGSLTSDL